MGQHDGDPIPIRCKLGLHKWEVLNKVRFSGETTGWHLIRRCERCPQYSSKTVK